MIRRRWVINRSFDLDGLFYTAIMIPVMIVFWMVYAIVWLLRNLRRS